MPNAQCGPLRQRICVDFLDGVDEVDLDTPRGRAQRERLSTAIAAQRSRFLFLGQEIGFDYASSNLITQDGTSHYVEEHGVEDPIFTYVPNARPGARAPHCWLAPRGESEVQSSTLDLFDREFVLLVAGDPAAWSKALDSCDEDIPVRVAAIGPPGSDSEWEDVEGTFQQRYGIGDGGAVLVRPDGHVAWRVAEGLEYPTDLPLSEALETSVGRRAPEAQPYKEKTE